MVRPSANPEQVDENNAQSVETERVRSDANQPGPALGISLLPYLITRCGRQKTIEMNQDFNISASV
jgi:hypothetical protein